MPYNLVNTTDKLQLARSTADAIDVHISYFEAAGSPVVVTGGRQNSAFSSIATGDCLDGPSGPGVLKRPSSMVFKSKGSNTNQLTLIYNANSTLSELKDFSLPPDWTYEWHEKTGWEFVSPFPENRLLTTVEFGASQRTIMSPLASHSPIHAFTMVSGTAYYLYLGRAVQDFVAKFIELQVTANGAGTQTAEVGIFSTPAAPNKSGQTLTKIFATGTVDALTSSSAKRNTASANQTISAGTHIWAAFRTAMATTQPGVGGIAGDMSQGHILTTTGGGALTGITTAAGTIQANSAATVCPELRITLD